MMKATRRDRQTAVAILTETFESNRSVNYIIKQDGKKLKRLKVGSPGTELEFAL